MKTLLIAFVILTPCCIFGQGVWFNDSLPAFGMSDAQSEVINGKIYVITWGIASIDNQGLATLDSALLSIFDPVQHTWTNPAQAVPFKGGFVTCSVSGKIYIIGAESDSLTNNMEVFDPASNTWSNISYSGIFTPRILLTASAVNGKIYAIGGFHHDKDLNIVEVFDPSSNSWTSPQISGSSTARDSHTACVLGGKIYIVGGENQYFIDKLEVFDPATNSWSTPTTSGTFTPRGGLTSSALDGKIYAIGGYNFAPKTNVLEVFDTATNTWTTPQTSGTFTARTGLTSSVVGNRIYTIGGIEFINSQNLTIFFPGNYNEVFSPLASEVKSEQSPELSLYPNPTTGIVSIQGAPSNDLNISVLNLLGETVMEQKNLQSLPDLTLDLSKLVPGTYYIRFSSANSMVTKKIIKN